MGKTRDQLVTKALFTLGCGTAGQAATADDYAAVDDEVDPFFSQIYAIDGILVQDEDNIENAWFFPLATMLAARLIKDFSVGPEESAELMAAAAQARMDLKVMVANQPASEILRMPDLRFRRRRWGW